MAVDRFYVARTTASRERLESVVGSLRDEDYGRDAGGGWTMGARQICEMNSSGAGCRHR